MTPMPPYSQPAPPAYMSERPPTEFNGNMVGMTPPQFGGMVNQNPFAIPYGFGNMQPQPIGNVTPSEMWWRGGQSRYTDQFWNNGGHLDPIIQAIINR